MDRGQATGFLHELLKLMRARGGSDLFLSANFPPAIKVDGELHKISPQPLTEAHTRTLLAGIGSDRQIADFERDKECNFAISPKDLGRYRVNVYMKQGAIGMVLRTIPANPPTIDQMQLPVALKTLVMNKRGLCILVGSTGSGKSTTLAAMLDYRNESSKGHILTVEDPVEFVHANKNCLISQREIGLDTDSWGAALKNALRQSPDVIMMGEIRDRETMEYALQVSETGHLCLATLHANNANQALDRIINFFPDERHPQVFIDLSMNLRGIVSQRLIPRQTGRGRFAAVEIMLNTPYISDLIAKGEISSIREVMKKGVNVGMQTFDQALFDAYESGVITMDDALKNAESMNDLRLQIKLTSKRAKGQDLIGDLSNAQLV